MTTSVNTGEAVLWVADKDYSLIDHGIDGPGTAITARNSARVHAIRVAAIAGAVWPHKYDEFIEFISHELISELIAFSIHARRAMEIGKVQNQKIEGLLYALTPDARNCDYETDLRTALNKIVHAREIKIFTIECEPSRFANLGDRRVTHAKVRSDRGDAVLVCPTALVFSFFAIESPFK